MTTMPIIKTIYISFSAQSRQYYDDMKPKSGICPSLIVGLQGFSLVHSSIDTTAHSRHLKSLEHCLCTTWKTNIGLNESSGPAIEWSIAVIR